MSPEAQRYLDRLEQGTLDLDAPELLEAAGRLPDLAVALVELSELQALLGSSSVEAQEVIAAAHAGAPGVLDRAQVERAMELPGQAARGGSGWRPWLSLAALLLVAFGLWARFSSSPAPYDPGPALGGADQAELVHPKGPTRDWGRFEWRAPTGPGLWFEVHVRNVLTGEEFSSEELKQTQWQTNQFKDVQELGWFVRCYRDSSNQFSDSPTWRASQLP